MGISKLDLSEMGGVPDMLKSPFSSAKEGSCVHRTNDVSKAIMPRCVPNEAGPLQAEVVHLNNQPLSKDEITTMVSDVNFVTRMRELVGQILAQLSRISENDRTQVETLKREYRTASHNVAEMCIKTGNLAPWVAGISLAISLSQLGNPNPDKIVELLAGHVVPKGGEFITSRYSAKQAEYSAIQTLSNTEISNKISKTQSESKNEILQLLNSTLEVLKRASSAN